MTAHEVRAPQPQARNSTSVICGAHIRVRELCSFFLMIRRSLISSLFPYSTLFRSSLGCVWQLTKCAHLNLRHAIPLVSFVVHALQFLKCVHLNSQCAIHW